MKKLYYGDTNHTLACIKENRAYEINNKISKGIIDILQKTERTNNFARDIHGVIQGDVFMYNVKEFFEKLDESFQTGYMKINIPVTKSFLVGLVHDYTNFVSTMGDDLKNQYHIHNALNTGNMTGFAKRHSGEHDFFLYREEFIFSGADRIYIAKMKNDKHLPKECKDFLAKCQLVYDAALLSLMSLGITMNYLRTLFPEKVAKTNEIPLQESRSRLVFRDYQKISPKGNLNCDSHIDSSLINSVIYQSKPGLEVSGYGKDNYVPIHIGGSEMVVFGGKYALDKTGFLIPSPHKVTSNARRRISIGFDLNPKVEYEKFVSDVAQNAYKKF